MASILQLYKELRRRNVFKVGVAYAVLTWLLIEIASTVLPAFKAPDWILQVFIFLLIAGLPVVLFIVWAFELTPEGIKRIEDVPDHLSEHQASDPVSGNRLNVVVISVLAVALAYFIFDEIYIEPGSGVVPSDSTVSANRHSIAVIPFANRSLKEEDAFFVDGIHDDILTQLAHIGSLKVISRTSVMDYRDTTKNLKTIGEELGVGTILEGGVQRAGNQVRINMQLIDAATDEHLWAQTFDRELTAANIFAIQTEISTTVAKALRVALSSSEQQRLNTVPTENLEAYESYLLGKRELAKRRLESFDKAVAHFERAIDLDADFALAWVGLGDAKQLSFGYTGQYRFELLEQADVAFQQALLLDPQLGEAYASLGLLETYRKNDRAAEAHLKRSLELAPNYVHGHRWYAGVLGRLGRHDEAAVHGQIAVDLDPRSMIANQNFTQNLAWLGRFDEALAQLDKVIKIDTGAPWPHFIKGDIYWFNMGRLDEAVLSYKKGLAMTPDDVGYMANLGVLYLTLGSDEVAGYWIERAAIINPDNYWSTLGRMLLSLFRGDRDEAEALAKKRIDDSPVQTEFAYRVLRDRELRAGRFDEALSLYKQQFGDLLDGSAPEISNGNYRNAIGLVPALRATGDMDRADMLLAGVLDLLNGESQSRMGLTGFGIDDARVYAMQGKRGLALNAIRDAIDMGWRGQWWYYVDQDLALESLRDEPQFQAMMYEVRDDLAAQLIRLRAIEPDGKTLVTN